MSFVQPILAQLLEQAQPFIEQLTVHADNAGVFTALAQARAVKDDVIASAVATGDRAGLFSPWFWMPEGVSWEDIKNYRLQGHLVPQLSDLNEIGVYIIYFALLRFVLEATLFRLLARIFLKHRPKELRTQRAVLVIFSVVIQFSLCLICTFATPDSKSIIIHPFSAIHLSSLSLLWYRFEGAARAGAGQVRAGSEGQGGGQGRGGARQVDRRQGAAHRRVDQRDSRGR